MNKINDNFKKAINYNKIDNMDLKTLNFINDLLDGKLTEKQKDQELKRLKKKVNNENKN